jgi:hypothetical protein
VGREVRRVSPRELRELHLEGGEPPQVRLQRALVERDVDAFFRFGVYEREVFLEVGLDFFWGEYLE